MPGWGATTSDESKPKWEWLSSRLANTFATDSGWAHRWPWGDEILVAIGGLATNLGVATLVDLLVSTAPVANAASQVVQVAALFNEPVTVTGTPTVVAIGTGVANATLTYSSADSDLTKGFVVFKSAPLDLAAVAVDSTFTVNATSTLAVWSGIKDAGNANAVANSVGTLTATVTVVAAE